VGGGVVGLVWGGKIRVFLIKKKKKKKNCRGREKRYEVPPE